MDWICVSSRVSSALLSWHLCEIYSVQCVYGLGSKKRKYKIEAEGKTQHKYTLSDERAGAAWDEDCEREIKRFAPQISLSLLSHIYLLLLVAFSLSFTYDDTRFFSTMRICANEKTKEKKGKGYKDSSDAVKCHRRLLDFFIIFKCWNLQTQRAWKYHFQYYTASVHKRNEIWRVTFKINVEIFLALSL